MPRCAESSCGRWRPERLAPGWPLGIRVNGDWYCSRACVEEAARADLDRGAGTDVRPPRLPVRVGALLRLEGVSQQALNAALASQRQSGRRLGAELVSLGCASSAQVLRALAAQGNVRYLASFDVSRAARAVPSLPAETVRALRLVPFDADGQSRRMRVVCAAPVPRAAVRAVQALTGWTPDVFMVEDHVWEEALAAYCAAEPAEAAEPVVVAGMDDAIVHVARAASAAREVSVRHARWERYTWVRVEAPASVSNVLVPLGTAGGRP